jgi:UDPglucose 6-dehydrogenase
MSNIGVVGVGYVGLTQAIGMASLGHQVIAYDIDKEKISKLLNNQSPFFEPGVEELLTDLSKSKNLIFTIDKNDLKDCDFIFLCLPTPQGEDGSADTSHLLQAVSEIAPTVKNGCFLIIKSTVPVGAWKSVKESLPSADFAIISNPEFLREGSALIDFKNPDRIVIGAETTADAKKVADLYQNIKTEVVLTDNTSAELVKYAANSFLAMKLSFVNDIAALSENLDANYKDVLHGIGLDHRIGNKFLTPGPGWGGSCFPKDVRALASIADKEKIMMPLLSAAIKSNENAQDRIVERVSKYFGSDLSKIKIAALGLAFKANTDDIRNSPAIEIILKLQQLGAEVVAYDPEAKGAPNITQVATIGDAVENADLIILLTEWDEFSHMNLDEISSKMRQAHILDTRGLVEKSKVDESNIKFIS